MQKIDKIKTELRDRKPDLDKLYKKIKKLCHEHSDCQHCPFNIKKDLHMITCFYDVLQTLTTLIKYIDSKDEVS
jgi:hypothetical protein